MRQPREPVSAVQRTYDFMVWLFPQVMKYPRDLKFTLGDHIQRLTLSILEDLMEASYTSEKLGLLHRANRRIEVLRFLLRFSQEMRCLSQAQFEHAMKLLHNVGAEVGGWAKQQRGKESG